MIRAAAWILEQESKIIHWIAADDADPTDVVLMHIVLAGGTAPIWGGVAMTPYWNISQAAAATTWAVDDIAYTKAAKAKYGRLGAKFRTMTAWNYFPRTRTFASRGGWRFAATKIGSRFLGPIGVGLLMIDAWSTGIWIGEKLFGEME